MDPRFKTKLFSNEDTEKDIEIETEIKKEMKEMTPKKKETEENTETEDEREIKKTCQLTQAAATTTQLKLWGEFDEEVEKERKAPTAKNALEIEYDTYMAMERLRRKDNP